MSVADAQSVVHRDCLHRNSVSEHPLWIAVAVARRVVCHGDTELFGPWLTKDILNPTPKWQSGCYAPNSLFEQHTETAMSELYAALCATRESMEYVHQALETCRHNSERTRETVRDLLHEQHARMCDSMPVVFSFYVGGDPFLPHYLCCVDSPGAEFPAAASHFLPELDETLVCGHSPQFYPDASIDPLREGNSLVVSALIAEDPDSKSRLWRFRNTRMCGLASAF